MAPSGTVLVQPSQSGSPISTANPLSNTPRVRLRELVSPVGKHGPPPKNGEVEKGPEPKKGDADKAVEAAKEGK